jgi:hypothetical protein
MTVYSIGQRVRLLRANPGTPVATRFTVVGRMPDANGGSQRYRVKGDGESHERVVPEEDLASVIW